MEPGSGTFVRGEVDLEGGGPLGSDLLVELDNLTGSAPAIQAPLSSIGQFSFDSVPPGEYQLRITNLSGAEIHSQFVSVSDSGEFVTVRVPRRKMERPVSGTVSVKDLKRKIDPKAAKELHKSQQAAAKGDTQKVIEHLRRAIDRDPAYMEAYNNLGAAYMQMNEFGRAVNEFQKAVELVPDSPMANSNLSVALYSLKRYPEAERAARQALKANPQSKRASLVLGMSLALEKRLPDEALDSLERAAPLFPRARLAAADLLAHQGQRDQAIEELKRYLKSGKVEDRQSVETWLAELQAAELPH